MTRSFWAAVGASVFAFALTPAAASAVSPGSAAAGPASTHANPDSRPVSIIHRSNAMHTPALVHPKRRASAIKRRVRRSAARGVAQRHVVGRLASGSGYRQAGGSGRVRVLQRRLAGLGFSPGPIDGRYGPLTTHAVERFQHVYDLTADGIVGAHSLAALNAKASRGLRPGAGYQQAAGSGRVRLLQRRLAGLGFSPGPIDRRYGPLTTRAVERFQSAHRLTVNGIVGARTLRALATVGRRFTPPVSAKGHPTTQPHPVVPEGLSIPARSVPGKRPPALPVALVLLALAALGVSTMSLSYGRTRSRVRRKPARGEQKPRGLASELVRVNVPDAANGGYRR
jgi:peptidoglycan hydrolase-like protein with peptidoglycan-binding domain